MGIMKRRRVGYEARQIPVHGKIGRDDKAGNGTHVWHTNDWSKKII